MPPRKRTPAKNAARTAAKKAAPALPPGRHPDFNVEAAIHDMPSTFIQCRDFNHSWRPFTAVWDQHGRHYEVELKCARCKTVRVRHIGQGGQLLGSRYDYVDGYVVKGMGRITGTERDALRLESIRRILPDDTVEE